MDNKGTQIPFETEHGYVRNCILKPRLDQEGAMFDTNKAAIIPRLSGYAIIPIEEYKALINESE